MFFTYSASVVLLSLAIYGILCLFYDLWGFYSRRHFRQQPAVSLLILVKNAETQVEYLLYELINRLESVEFPCDAVIVDCGSEDLTYEIVSRMTAYSPLLEACRIPGRAKPVNEALPLCRGSVVHIVDLVSRIPVQEFMPTVNQLLWSDRRNAAMGRS